MEEQLAPEISVDQRLPWENYQSLIEAVSSSLALQEVIQRLADGVVKDLGYPACYVNLYHPEEDSLSIVGFAPRGKLLAAAEKMLRLQVDRVRFPFTPEKSSLYARIFRGEEFVIREYSELVSPQIPESVAHASQRVFGVRCILVVPLRTKEELLGVFLVGSAKEDFSGLERETLRAIARHASIAMEKALLYQNLERAKAEAEAMAEIAQDLSTSLDLRRTLRKISHYARKLCQADMSLVALYHKDHGYATITDSDGARTEVYQNLRIYPGRGIGGKVLETGRSWMTDDFLHDSRLSGDYQREAKAEGVRSVLAVPIMSQQEVAGILWVVNRSPSPFRPQHQRVLQKLAAQAGIAILNAKLFEESREALHRQKTLVEIVAAINSYHESQEILSVISRSAAEFCGGDAAAVFGLSEQGCLTLLGGYNLSPDFANWIEEAQISPEEAAISKAFISGFPVEVFDPSIEPVLSSKLLNLLRKEGLQTFITMSLARTGKTIGALSVFRRSLQHFGSEQINLLNTLSQHAAVALERNFLYREMKDRNDRLALLGEIAKGLASSLDSELIYRSLIEKLVPLLHFQGVYLYLFQGENDCFLIRSLYQEQSLPSLQAERTMLAAETPASIAFFARKPFLVKDTRQSDLALLNELKELGAAGITSVLYVPILAEENPLGVLAFTATDSPGFHRPQIALLNDLSPYLALALKNARLYSDLKQTMNQLHRAQEQVMQAEKLKVLGEMASGVAHDFNNLLATILVRAEIMERCSTDPQVQEWARVIQKTALDGAETVRRLRSFYRQVEEDERISLDLNQLILEAIHRTEPKWKDEAQASGIVIQFETQLAPLGPILGNPCELHNVFINLIFNAIEALPQGGKITISTSLRDQGSPAEAVEVAITDNGVGMSEQVLRQAFDPFFTTKGPNGSGLGLPVSRGIIERHGGEISIRSAPGIGTTVLVRLPSSTAPLQKKKKDQPLFDLPPLRILVIEDEQELAQGLQKMLTLLGHQVDLASGGQEGLHLFAEKRYDLVFTDLGMPDLTGIEVARSLCASSPLTPVLLITGWGDQLDPNQLRKEIGIRAVIPKPFRMGDILQAIQECFLPPS
jgi:GAF domain-containing protein/CheY-like chemotaxis protein